MEHQDIGRLTGALFDALQKEYDAKVEAETARTEAATLQARKLDVAYAQGVIDGKNADIRKHQEVVILADDEACQEALANLSNKEKWASATENERRRVEAIISLTRAWLYSQRPEL